MISNVDLTVEVNRAGDESTTGSTTPLVMESTTTRVPKTVIPVHQARSHDEFRSPDLNFTVWSPTAF